MYAGSALLNGGLGEHPKPASMTSWTYWPAAASTSTGRARVLETVPDRPGPIFRARARPARGRGPAGRERCGHASNNGRSVNLPDPNDCGVFRPIAGRQSRVNGVGVIRRRRRLVARRRQHDALDGEQPLVDLAEGDLDRAQPLIEAVEAHLGRFMLPPRSARTSSTRALTPAIVGRPRNSAKRRRSYGKSALSVERPESSDVQMCIG